MDNLPGYVTGGYQAAMHIRKSIFLCLLALPFGVAAQTPGEALRSAALSADAVRVEELVRARRLEVKPVVRDLVSEVARTGASGEEAPASRDAARLLASTFEQVFGEKSLSLLTSQLDEWTSGQMAQKAAADSLLSAGIAIRVSDRPAAAMLFEEAEKLYEALGDLQGIAEVRGQLGYVAWYLDRDTYIPRNLEALEARRKADDLQLVGNTFNDLGLGNRVITQDYEAALGYYFEGEKIRRAIGDSVALASMLPNIGRTYEAMGDYVKARDFYLKGAEFYLAVGDSANWIIQRRNTAGLMTNYAGRHTDALAILMGLQQDLERINDARAEALVRLSLGVVRRRLGDYRGAIAEYQDVIRLAEENQFDDLLSQALNNVGVVYIFMERPDRAVGFLQRAYEADSSNANEPPTTVLLSLSSAHYQMRNYEEAESWLGKASELASSRADEANIVKMRADIRTRTGKETLAKEGYEELLALSDELETPRLRSDAYFGLAEADERLGDADAALGYYELAAATLEEERGMLTSEEDKAGVLAQTRYLYEEIIHFLTRQSVETGSERYAAKAFEFAERGKARAFLDQMAEALAGVRSGVDPELQSDLDILAENMAALRAELAATDRSDRARVSELKGMVREMEGEYERVEREMLERNPRFASIRYPDPVTVPELQQDVLAEGELLLQYALGDSSSTLWAVTRSSIKAFALPVRSEIDSQVEVLRFALEDPARDADAAASQLYDILMQPVASLTADASQIVVVPDGSLNYVPFESLMDGEGTYVVFGAPISYAQSASVLRQLRGEVKAEPSMELLAVGDPAFGGALEAGFLRSQPLARLPFTGTEVSGIASLFPATSTKVLMDEQATQDAVTSALAANTFRFVHFATHGLVNDDRPDFSGLALAGSGTDALLQSSEIFNLDINADLVVLSACETGLGQLVKGEGMVGLTRAFMYAGAPSVAVSLWSVSDQSTASLMDEFYSGMLKSGRPKADALRAAKLKLLADASTQHPFHWAPFVLVGLSD